jgi:hypothetical protein
MLAGLAACTTATSTTPADPDIVQPDGCGCDQVSLSTLGAIGDPQLDELSGLAASRRHPGLLYAHNDSGDRARLFVLDDRGKSVAELAIDGTLALDWEDIAAAPCGEASCIVIANTGNNGRFRSSVNLVRLREPAQRPSGRVTLIGENLPFTYPDARQDTEALALDGDQALLIAKVSHGKAPVYTVDWRGPAGVTQVAVKIGALDLPGKSRGEVTAADLRRDACGVQLLVRSRGDLFLFEAPVGATLAELVAGAPRQLPVEPAAAEPQPEAVAWSVAGGRFVSASEGPGLALHEGSCRP